ncbi:hypothetical protein JTB14_003726 [Gonioctena quinquepunctata]|nr:hypothetical protein JTB14_003726 [Gonioctena quinquepunctata]
MFVSKFFCGLFIVITLELVESDTALKQLHVVFRHGERAPTETYPNDPYIDYKWSGDWGHLTNRGKLQMYILGQLMKVHYKNFIPDVYWHKDVNITSSYADRCIMSGQLFCAVFYIPRNQDYTIVMKAKCDKYDKISKELRKSPEIVELERKYQYLMEYLTEKTGKNITNIEDVEMIYNTLEIEMLNNLTLPSWVNETMMNTMRMLGARNLAFYSETQYMQRVKGGVFLKHVITSMANILDGKEEPKLYFYSGHDLTLVHVLRALQLVGTTLKPGFGASLVLELYSDGEVKLIYRDSFDGDPEVMSAYQCPTPCKVQDFKKSLEAVLPNDLAEECALNRYTRKRFKVLERSRRETINSRTCSTGRIFYPGKETKFRHICNAFQDICD